MGTKFLIFACFLSLASHSFALTSLGPQGINLWRLDAAEKQASDFNVNAVAATTDFPVQFFEQPLDHFDKSIHDTFKQRYWVSTRHYTPRPGAPVIVLDGGETSGTARLQFLDTGIVDILTRATGGVGVVLEHRYYGGSVPVANFTTDSLRFLNNAQAAADSANFMRNVKFAGIAEDLTAPGTPWIYYGGSYAGARSAHMKVLYPDIVWGAIASSGVTYANLEDWQYMDIIRRFADSKCSEALVNSIAAIDDVLLHGSAAEKHQLKALFGLAGLEHDDDFANVLQGPLGAWQNQNWVPSLASTKFTTFCQALTAPSGNLSQRDLAQRFDHPDRRVVLDARTNFAVDASVANYAAYINSTTASRCKTTAESCFGSNNVTSYQQTGLDQTWRLWQFQVCTEWGFFTTAPPPNVPRIISKLSTLEYQSKICKQAYPPGKHFRVPPQPDVEVVNRLGGFNIAADRLAIIDGEDDPWRPNTPHSDDAKPRKDTTLRPFKLIPNGVHHYDEYGLADPTAEPPQIQLIHSQMVDFVKSWLEDWSIKHSIKTK